MKPDDATNGTRRLAVLQVSDALILGLCRGRVSAAVVVRDPIPEDAKIVGMGYDGWVVSLTLESDSFGPVPEGGAIPVLASPTLVARVYDPDLMGRAATCSN